MKVSFLLILFVILLSSNLIPSTSALYEEQAGVNDWTLQSLGPLHSLSPALLTNKRPVIYTLHDNNVLAAIKLSTGQIQWRQVLPKNEIVHVMQHHEKHILVATSLRDGSPIIRLFSTTDGSLIWDYGTYHETTTISTPTYVNVAWVKDQHVAVIAQNQVLLLAGNDGRVLWTWRAPTDGPTLHSISTLSSTLRITATSSNKLVFYDIDIESGSMKDSHESSINGESIVNDKYVWLLDPTSHDITTVEIATGQRKTTPNIFPPSSSLSRLSLTHDISSIFIHTPSHTYSVTYDGSSHQLQDYNDAIVDVIVYGDKQYIGKANMNGEFLTIEVLDRTKTRIATIIDKLKFPQHGPLRRLFLIPHTTKGASSPSFRTFLLSSDASLAYFSSSSLTWIRDDALALVNQMQWVDLPLDLIPVKHDHHHQTWVEKHIPHAQYLVEPFQRLLGMDVIDPRQKKSAAGPLVQDHFGFRKLILSITSVGKIYALDSAHKGNIIWSTYVLNGENEEIYKVVMSQRDQIMVVTHTKGTNPFSTLYFLDALTGELTQTTKLNYIITQLISLPYIDLDDNQLILLIHGNEIDVWPNTKEAKDLLEQHRSNLFYYHVDKSNGTVSGYTIVSASSGYRGVNTWTHAYPQEIETISSVAAHASNEVVQSSVRVLGGGDGGVLHRYLNPSLLAIATTRTSPLPGTRTVPSIKRTSDPSVNIYLIDTVTGVLLDKIVHRGGVGPVHMVLTENILVYHYFNSISYDYEVSVCELYDTEADSKPFHLASAVTRRLTGLGDDVEPWTSRGAGTPNVMQQTYLFRNSIKAMGVTQTKKGIAGKEFLFALSTDQLLAIGKPLLDPRRPTGDPTPQDRAEGLVPYSSDLPIQPLHMLTYNQTIPRLEHILTAPAVLESTSLVVAWGIDIFFTRTTPSQTFDLLNEDFNHPFLLLTVSGVALLIIITYYMSKRKELSFAWK